MSDRAAQLYIVHAGRGFDYVKCEVDGDSDPATSVDWSDRAAQLYIVHAGRGFDSVQCEVQGDWGRLLEAVVGFDSS